MDAGKLGRYITSKAFLDRANAAVVKAVGELEARGIKPVYIERASPRAVLKEVRERRQYIEQCNRLNALLDTPAGARQVDAATTATASALLLAKTAMPSEETKFLSEIRRQLASVCADPALIQWARTIIDGELANRDSIRDRAIIDDALFERRISAIRQVLDGPEARQL
ncbi:hypothetical protein [Caballeronia grimmiae]|uniref:hypothetical protein n=1 Tax=Caballeronia grimmiae TaxID=1071679 RepID=UPI0038BD07CE